MSYTTTLLDQVLAQKNITSDYALARELNLTRAAISRYRNGNAHADDRIAIVLADALGLDRMQTIARINADRSKKATERAFWRRIASAAAVVGIALIAVNVQDAQSNEAFNITTTQYALWYT